MEYTDQFHIWKTYCACLVEFLDGDGPLEERFASLTGLHVVVPACGLGKAHLAAGLRLVSLRLPLRQRLHLLLLLLRQTQLNRCKAWTLLL